MRQRRDTYANPHGMLKVDSKVLGLKAGRDTHFVLQNIFTT